MTPAEVEAKLREEDFRGPMQHLRSWSELDALHLAAADALAAQAVELKRMREALRQIADGSAPPIPHGHYLAHRRAVDVARVALSVKAG